MMIGGGGRGCSRSDHGIGITENEEGTFVEHISVFMNRWKGRLPEEAGNQS